MRIRLSPATRSRSPAGLVDGSTATAKLGSDETNRSRTVVAVSALSNSNTFGWASVAALLVLVSKIVIVALLTRPRIGCRCFNLERISIVKLITRGRNDFDRVGASHGNVTASLRRGHIHGGAIDGRRCHQTRRCPGWRAEQYLQADQR